MTAAAADFAEPTLPPVSCGRHWRWQQSWVFLGELGLSSFAVSFWLLRHDPALLESRLTTPVCPEVLRA